MNDVEISVEELALILKKAEDKNPDFLRGLLIPDDLLDEFYYLIGFISREAKKAKKNFKLMMEGESVREQMQIDFIEGIAKIEKELRSKIK